jgi:hypothetical protein
MKFSMNGYRRKLSHDVQLLRNISERIALGNNFDSDELVIAVNNVITDSNIINCVYDDKESDFTDMSNLSVEHIKINV